MPKGGVSDNDIDDYIVDLFDKRSGAHISINQIVPMITMQYPTASQIDVVRVLQTGKQRGDYDQDDVGDWFRRESE